ncbi:hypothetical protein KWG61_11950 [Allobaculum sp. Allo2]|nr:hypothetical protein KWG61_11950 [Allobaculum sp. Allo2]
MSSNAPTPGKMSLEQSSSSAGEEPIFVSRPRWLQADVTEWRLPIP